MVVEKGSAEPRSSDLPATPKWPELGCPGTTGSQSSGLSHPQNGSVEVVACTVQYQASGTYYGTEVSPLALHLVQIHKKSQARPILKYSAASVLSMIA